MLLFSQVQVANVLFVDNPVGTGYSYVTEDSAYTTDVSQIAADLMTLFSQFLEDLPVFKVSLDRHCVTGSYCVCKMRPLHGYCI